MYPSTWFSYEIILSHFPIFNLFFVGQVNRFWTMEKRVRWWWEQRIIKTLGNKFYIYTRLTMLQIWSHTIWRFSVWNHGEDGCNSWIPACLFVSSSCPMKWKAVTHRLFSSQREWNLKSAVLVLILYSQISQPHSPASPTLINPNVGRETHHVLS